MIETITGKRITKNDKIIFGAIAALYIICLGIIIYQFASRCCIHPAKTVIGEIMRLLPLAIVGTLSFFLGGYVGAVIIIEWERKMREEFDREIMEEIKNERKAKDKEFLRKQELTRKSSV